MASNDANTAQDTDAEPSGGGMKKIILFGAIVLLSVGGSIAGTVFYLQSQAPAAPDEAVVEAAAPSDARLLYHSMRPPFVVNFMVGDKARLLQTEVTIASRDPEVMEAVVSHGPLLRNKLINLLGDQDILEMQTIEGKRQLKDQARLLIDATLEGEAGVRGVERVLLTNFVMQ